MKWDPYDAFADPFPVYRWLRDTAPVYRTPTHGYYALSRYEDIANALQDHHTFRSQLTAFPKPEHLPIVQMDPPKHDELRAVIAKPFSPREVGKLEERIRGIVTRRLDALAARGGGDWVTEFAELVPSELIGGMLGVPEAERSMLGDWARAFMSRDSGSPLPPPRAIVGYDTLKQYFIVARRECDARPRDDLMTSLSQARVRGARLSDLDYAAMCSMLAVAGYETTTNLLCHAFHQLYRHPEQRAWLASQPTEIPNAIKETLRFCTPTILVHRMTAHEVRMHDCTIPRGAPMVLLLASAGRDERRYVEPDRFDIRRVNTDHLAFGLGRHTCFGAPLARLETKIVLEETLRRFPSYTIDEASLEPSGPGASSGFRRMLTQL